jgi:hypothetical protein
MSDKLIMEVFVETTDRMELESTAGTIVMIPFTGTVKSEIFNGELLPGGVDTQVINKNGIKHMSARYMAEGTDHTGEKCKIYIQNEGHFPVDAPKPFKTIPTFYTDSKALAPYLHSNKFRGEGMRDESGLVIRFFEIL